MRLICAYHNNLYLDAYEAHLAEMRAMGFDTVVLCVPEHYVRFSLPAVRDLIVATGRAGLACWADPWGVAGVFDGEAPHDPAREPEATIAAWLLLVAGDRAARPDAVFWDNPHPADPARIGDWTSQARRLGMGSVVCLSADRHRDRVETFGAVAARPTVDGIGCDPYCLGRNERFDVEGHVSGWAERMVGLAAASGKEAHVWVQGFNLAEGYEDLPVRAARTALARGVGGIGYWSYRSCEATSNRPARPRETWRRFGEFAAGLKA